MNTIQDLLRQAEALNDVPVKSVNGRIMATPSPVTVPAGRISLRSAIKSATQTSGDALSHIKLVRKEHSATLDTAKGMIAKAEQRALDYLQLADFIDKKSDSLPNSLGATQIEAAIAIRAAREAGLEVSPSISSEIKELARVSHAKIKHSTAVHDRRAAAWKLAFNKQCAALFKSFAQMKTPKAAIFERAAKRYSVNLVRAEASYDAIRKAFDREAGRHV
jgi:hypothetical protein